MSNIQILHILKTHYLGKIHCPNTTPEPITGEVGLPIIKMYLLSVKKNQNNEATATFIKMKRGLIRAQLAKKTNSLKKHFCPTLADLKSPAKLATNVTEQ